MIVKQESKRIWRRYDIEFFQSLAADRGGACLSIDYAGVNVPLNFRCQNGHEFAAKPTYLVHKGHWCPQCGGQFYDVHRIGTFQTLAKNKGGQCLSDEYTGMRGYLHFRCSLGHEWKARAHNMLHRGSWCPQCAHGERRTVIS
jgi:Zn finger protein HypA/HybF involved in hydrogenase expression